jgi:hypothetical protein
MVGRGEGGRRSGGWPPRSRGRYKKAIPPAVVALAGLVLMLALPSIPNVGLIFFLGGLSATILSVFLAGLGD